MHDVAETDVRGFLQPASVEDYWTYATEVLAGAVAGLAAADDAARDRIRAAVLGEVRTFEHDGQPQLPLHARCIIGTKLRAPHTTESTDNGGLFQQDRRACEPRSP